MQRAGLTAVGLGLDHLAVAAKLLGRPVPFRIVAVGKGRLAASPGQSAIAAATVEAAKKEVYYHGLATVEQIVDALSASRAGTPPEAVRAVVVETLPLLGGFGWLVPGSGWFRLAGAAKHGVPKAVDKVLAVAPRVSAEDLAKAVGRSRRPRSIRPPADVLAEFCRELPGVRVEGPWVVADPPRAWEQVLSGVEAQLAGIFRQHGPIVERSVLEDLCVEKGVNRFSFHAFLASSPIIAQYGHSVYGLIGAEVAPGVVESLLARHRTERSSMRVLDAHGRMADGRIWLSYRLSKAVSTYAVITVPAELKDAVSGKFDLVTAEGRQVGVLAASDGLRLGPQRAVAPPPDPAERSPGAHPGPDPSHGGHRHPIMHEVAIADALIAQVQDEVDRVGASGRVTRIALCVGRLSGVSADALRFALELLAKGTILDSARIDLAEPRAVCRCAACGGRTEIDDIEARCPRCGEADVTIEGGRELLLESIEVEENP